MARPVRESLRPAPPAPPLCVEPPMAAPPALPAPPPPPATQNCEPKGLPAPPALPKPEPVSTELPPEVNEADSHEPPPPEPPLRNVVAPMYERPAPPPFAVRPNAEESRPSDALAPPDPTVIVYAVEGVTLRTALGMTSPPPPPPPMPAPPPPPAATMVAVTEATPAGAVHEQLPTAANVRTRNVVEPLVYCPWSGAQVPDAAVE